MVNISKNWLTICSMSQETIGGTLTNKIHFPKEIDFPRFNMKCSRPGKRDTMRNISCSIMFSTTFHVISRTFGLLFGQCVKNLVNTIGGVRLDRQNFSSRHPPPPPKKKVGLLYCKCLIDNK